MMRLLKKEVLPNPDDINFFVTQTNDEYDDEEKWEFEGEPMNNIFNIPSDETHPNPQYTVLEYEKTIRLVKHVTL